MRFINLMFSGLLLTAACASATPISSDASQSAADAIAVSMAPFELGQRVEQQTFSPQIRAALSAASERLADLQADIVGDNAHNGVEDADPDDGGWDWTPASQATSHSSVPSADNAFGATGLGPWAALKAGLDSARARNTLFDLALGVQLDPDINSPLDFLFLSALGELFDNPGLAEIARQRYAALNAAGGGARAIGERDRDERHAGGQDGVIPFDLAWRSLGAAALDSVFPGEGYGVDAATYADIVAADLASDAPRFDIDDPAESFYVTGLAWSLTVLPSRSRLRDAVLAQLLAAQNEDGSWGWNWDHPDANAQSTAHALTALVLQAEGDPDATLAERNALDWLLDTQAANGGWSSGTDQENPQVDAEIMLALYLWELGADSVDALEPRGPEPEPSVQGSHFALLHGSEQPAAPPIAVSPTR